MTEAIKFFTNPMSRGRVVHWMLEEVGAPYQAELLDFTAKDHKKAEYVAINPMGKIPTIVDRGVVITETGAICAYLADRYPQAALAPGLDDPARGAYLRWMFFAAACVEPAIVDKMLKRPKPEGPGTLGYGSYEDVLSVLTQALTPGPFLLGERFSAADVMIGSQLGWGMMAGAVEPGPVFGAYAARFGERPAFQRALAANEELAKQLKARKTKA